MSVASDAARPQRIAKGIAFIVAAMFATSVQDVIFKFFSDSLPLGQIFALRALLALPLFVALAYVQGLKGEVLRYAFSSWPLLRAFCITIMFLAFYAAIPFLPLSVLGAGTYTAPIFVTLLSAYVIGEAVGLRGWIAVLAGFAGVLILLQPGTDAFSAWALLPLAGAIFYATAHVITRSRCQAVPLAALALSLNLCMLLAGLAVSGLSLLLPSDNALVQAYPYLFGDWAPIGAREWLVLALLAIFTVGISLGIAGAYQAAPPPIVATFDYCYLVFVACWDLLFFDSPPSLATILGMLLIIGAGLLIARR